MGKWILHDFYCINCGQKNYTLPRKHSKKRPKFHRKKLYCYHCKQEINCVECKNEEEVNIFKQQYEDGYFKKEVEESIKHIQKEERK